MSRIIVKNLPSKTGDEELKTFFGSRGGIVTDAKVIRKKDGTSRRFAFVGFKTESDAQEAAKYFNQAFMNTVKLDVHLAKELHDESLVTQRDRRKRKREAVEREAEKAKGKKKLKSTNEDTDEKLKEYLSVMKPQSSTAMWKNENQDMEAPTTAAVEKEDEEDVNDFTKTDQNSDVEDGSLTQNEESNGKTQESDEESLDTDEELAKMRTSDEVNEARDEEMTDMDWLKNRRKLMRDQKNINSDEEEETSTEQPQQYEQSEQFEQPEPEVSADEKILSSGRLFLRNLSYDISEQELGEHFGKFGSCKAHVPVDPRTDKPKGFAFITFDDPNSALSAFRQLDGSSFQGRLLHILAADPVKTYTLDEFDLKNMPLKKQKLLKKKAQAAKQQFSWNSLYLNRDAVLEITAKKLGITKSQMMDPHSTNMAVKQALAESSVLESVQNYFKSKGVDLQKFTTGDTTDKVILVKNIPFGTSVEEISDMFGAYGELVRVLMPPEGGLAIVQFVTAPSGRAAFSKVAFKRLGNSILYLQKAPKGLLEESELSSKVETKPKEDSVRTTSAKDLLAVDTDGTVQTVHTSIFVKNLNFTTTHKDFAQLFSVSPGFVSAQIKVKPDPKNPGKTQSMGYGFAEFDTLEHAELAISALQHHKLDGHELQLKISTRGQDQAKSTAKKATTKIVIKNVPFETTKKDIVDLFGTFGKLKTVRLPRKFNKQTRGFAFAEFATVSEAENAMRSLSGAHLLGRRLVMEFAQADAENPEEEIARMEAKVKNQVEAEGFAAMKSKGQMKGFDMDEE